MKSKKKTDQECEREEVNSKKKKKKNVCDYVKTIVDIWSICSFYLSFMFVYNALFIINIQHKSYYIIIILYIDHLPC